MSVIKNILVKKRFIFSFHPNKINKQLNSNKTEKEKGPEEDLFAKNIEKNMYDKSETVNRAEYDTENIESFEEKMKRFIEKSREEARMNPGRR